MTQRGLRGHCERPKWFARQIQQAIARDGFFVRVPAGKQFYLYVTETIDQSEGVRGNVESSEVWRTDNEA